jgi:hypothetical protein
MGSMKGRTLGTDLAVVAETGPFVMGWLPVVRLNGRGRKKDLLVTKANKKTRWEPRLLTKYRPGAASFFGLSSNDTLLA